MITMACSLQRSARTGLLLALIASASGAALAQATPAAPAPAAAAADDGGIAEIVVTAQRRAQNLQNVPIAVTALAAKTLEAANIQGTPDLVILTPGLTFNSVGGYGQPRIRGIGTTADTPTLENPIATYVDGVYYAHQGGSILSFNNIERIEVLKGPQGTLFGRNATGGLIQIITREPGQAVEGEASLSYENYKTLTANAYLGGGLSETVAADLALYVRRQGDGYGDNLVTGQEINKTDSFAARSKWVATPGDHTKLTFIADYARNSGATAQGPAPGTTPPGGTPLLDGQDVAVPAPYRNRFTQGGASLKIEHEFDVLHFVSTTAYRKSRGTIFFPNAVTDPAFLTLVKLYDRAEQASQEFQLQSPAGAGLDWTAGLYLFYADGGWRPAALSGGGLAPLTGIAFDSGQKTYSGALYGQSTIHLGEGTGLTLGLRYTIDRRKWHAEQSFDAPFPLGPFADEGKKTFRKLTWRVSLDHKFDSGVLVYASANRGFKSGGFNDLVIPATPYLPETLDAYEVGLKSTLFDRRLRFNAAGFYYDYKNLQVTRYSNGILVLYNGAGAEIYGLDLDAEASVSSRLRLGLGLSLVHGRYTSFPNADITTPAPGGGTIIATGSAKGNRLSYTPDWTLNLSADYSVPLPNGSLDLNMTYYHSDGFVGSPDERLRQGRYDTLNASFGWTSRDKNWAVTAFGRNLTDKRYAAAIYAQANGDGVQYAAPRTYGLRVRRSF
ncbi:TonB-dependent receptor [Rhizorhabdus wittichii]|uniref:TonB-dependent receptor n=1 Tax=Rhizorhabdus wittichii TaxID=160791 RepID=A0A975HG00_9SPHN|nr:TonB-dependent receptor [Rhizorhabdus wittichii]QTH23922.1 TonB-dependent receptor [Rhizorhabdus wittichii]